jgi:hypothetical protein
LSLQPCAQNFGHAPRLADATARRERRFGIKNLIDRADAAFIQMPFETD